MKRLILSAAIAMATVAFSAQAVQVRPLYTEQAKTKTAGVMTVANDAKVDKTYQVSVDRWTVANGKQVRTKTTDLRFAPSIFTVKAGKVQTVRWAIAKEAQSGSEERLYRITVKEVADPALSQLGGVLNLITVDTAWVWRPEGAAPQLSARWDGGVLVVKNTGNATARLVDLVAGSVSKKGLVGYVLPGDEQRFDVGAKAKVAVSVQVNGKDATLDAK